MLPWRQKQLVRDLVKGGIEENPVPRYSKNISEHCWEVRTALYSKNRIPQRGIVHELDILHSQNIVCYTLRNNGSKRVLYERVTLYPEPLAVEEPVFEAKVSQRFLVR